MSDCGFPDFMARQATGPDAYCPECQGDLSIPEHGAGCTWAAEQMLDYAWDRWEAERER